MSPAYGCRGPAFPPSPEDVETFQAYLLCSPPDDGFCQQFPQLSTSWLSPYDRIQTWVVEVARSDVLENITFRWEIPEVPNGVSVWLLDPLRQTVTNVVAPFSPEHIIPMDFEGTTSFVICGFTVGEQENEQEYRDECLTQAALSIPK